MKRTELMEMLKEFITSFNVDYNPYGDEVVDKEKDFSWLFEDEYVLKDKLPIVIPKDFLENTIVECDGIKLIAQNKNDTGRKISLSVVDYGQFGNTHKYGELSISGVKLVDERDNTLFHSTELSRKNPLYKSWWKCKLCKIFTEQDMNAGGDWYGYEPGMSIERFYSYVELFATAAYISLLRVEGEFMLFCGEVYVVPTKDDILLTVDSDDNVTIGKYIKEILQIKFDNISC